MKQIRFFAALLFSFFYADSQNFAALYFPGYQFGKTSITSKNGNFNYSTTYMNFSGSAVNKDFFFEADATALFHGFLSLIKVDSRAQNENPVNIDAGFFSSRWGKMYGKSSKLGIALDADIRATNFKNNQGELFLGTGPMLVGLIPVVDGITIMPKVGYDWVFSDRQTKPVDGNAIILESAFGFTFLKGWGISIQPSYHMRKFIEDEGAGTYNIRSNAFFIKVGLCIARN